MAVGIKRWLVMRCLTTTSASAKAFSGGDALLDHHLRFGESLFRLAAFLVKSESGIVGPFRMDGWSARRERLFGVRDGLGGFVFHFDGVDGVGGDVAIGGDGDGDRMSDEVDAIRRQDGVWRDAQAGQRRATGNGAD